MDAATDRIPALSLTLEHYLPVSGGDWVRVTGLTLDGTEVVVTTGDGTSIRVPASRSLKARRSGEPADPAEERAVERQLSGWYAGDLPAAERALDVGRAAAPAAIGPRVAYGHPVPEFVRDSELVGVFGGDLDAVLDTLGPQTDEVQRARNLRRAAEQSHLAEHDAHEDGSPPDPVADDELVEDLAGYYGGDLGAVTP